MNATKNATRRDFIKTSVATTAAVGALAGPIAFPEVLSAAPNSNKLRVGLVGCGGRGTGAASQALTADSNVELTAMGELFEAPLKKSLEILRQKHPDKVKVSPERCFIGFDAYEKVIANSDVVLLATAPGFRPQHLKATIDAGRHAFVEITLGVDAPGVRLAMEASDLATKKNLGILSGFCWRYNEKHRAVREQIRRGVIGPIRAIYATFYRGSLTQRHHGDREPWMSELQWQIRNWHNYLWLSGDVTILLSGGHSVDKMSWWLDDVMPLKAIGVGGRCYEAEGNIFDNGFVVYEYASGVRGFLGCRSMPGCHNENADYIIGARGICTIGRSAAPFVTGEVEWRYGGPENNMYQTEHDEFFASIRAGKPINDGPRMARTTMMGIMGRMAAYTGQEITWEMALNSQQKLVPDRLDWNTKVEAPPLATPGRTKFL